MKKYFYGICILLSVFFMLSCQTETEDHEKINISSLTFNEESCTMEIGQQRAFPVNFNPKNADVTDDDFSYKLIPSDICKIVKTDKSGCIVESIKGGSCVLQCSCQGYSAYVQLEINNPVLSQIPYISLPYTDIKMEIGTKRTIVANVVGGMKEDFSQFIWESSNPSVASVESSSNVCVIEAKKKGICTVTVSNPNVKYPSQMLIVIPQKENDIFYITTKDNVINLKEGDVKDFEVEIIGGEETDYSDIVYKIKNGEGIISLSGSGKKCSIKAEESGEAIIEVIHKKSKVNLNVKVIVNTNKFEGGIECDTDFIVLSDFSKKELVFELNGIKGGEWSYTLSESNIAEVLNINNKFIINAKNEGKTILSVYNSLIEKPFEVLIVCENLYHDTSYCQITTEQNVIRCEKGENGIELSMKLLGGNETDQNGFEWEISDSTIINAFTNNGKIIYSRSAGTDEQYIEGKCYINALQEGKATICIRHPKSNNEVNVEVYVYPQGTFQKKELIIKGDNFISCEIDNTIRYFYKITAGEINDTFTVSVKDDSIINVDYDKNGSIIIKALKEGYTSFVIDADNIKKPYKVDVFCGTREQIINNCYISADLLSVEGMSGNNYFIEIFNSNKNNKLSVSSSNTSVCNVSCIENIVSIEFLEKGNAFITVKGNLSNNVLSIPVYVYDEESINDISFIKGKSFYKLIKGKECKIDLSVINSSKGTFSFSYDENLIKIIKKNGSYYISPLSNGYGSVVIEHSECYLPFRFIYNVYETQNEADDQVLLYCDYDLIQGEQGKDICFTLKASEGIIEEIIPEISDGTICSIDTKGDLVLVHLNNPGNAIIKLNALNSFIELNVNCINNISNIENDTNFSVPSVISCIVNETSEIKCAVSNDYKSHIIWKYPSEFTGYSNNDVLRFIPQKEGSYEIECSLFSEIKKCIIHVFSDKEEMNNSNYFISEKLLYYTKKGNSFKINVSLFKDIPEEIISNIRWEIVKGDCIQITYTKTECEVSGIKEGKSEIKVYIDGYDNIIPLTFEIIVNKSEITEYNFSAPRVIEIDKNGGGFNFYLLQNETAYGNIDDYKDVRIINYNEELESSIKDNYVRLYSDKNGSYKITLTKPGFNDFSILVIVKQDLNVKEDVIFCETDSIILTKNEKRRIEIYSNGFDLNDVNISVNGENCISVEKVENGIYEISYINDGECNIKCSYKEVSYNIKVNCISSVYEEVNISCEPYIILKENENYETNVFCKNTVQFECKDRGLCIEADGNKCTMHASEERIYELKVYLSEENYRYIYVYVYKDINNRKSFFNIPKRIHKLSINEEIQIVPSVYNCSLDEINYDYAEVPFAEISQRNGILQIKAVKSGYFEVNALYNNQKIVLYFYVKNDSVDKENSSNISNAYFISSEFEYIKMNPGLISNINVYLNDLNGNKINDFSSLIWKTDNKDLFSINTLNNSCTISALKTGKGYIYVSSLQAQNVYVITVEITDDLSISEPYLYTEKRNLYFDITEKERYICISLNNCTSEQINNISYKCENNIFNITQKIINEKLYLYCSPVECGSSKIIISHPLCKDSLELFVTVKSNNESKTVFLTTQQNYITMRPGQTKSVSVDLIGEEITDSSDIKWELVESNDVITLIGKGENIQVYANKEGLSHLKVKYIKSDWELDIYIEVNSYSKDVKYITTDQNVIECTVSKTMDFFTVNLIGGSEEENQYFECNVDNKDIVSVICDGNTIYFRGLKPGQALLNISNERSKAANILNVRILVEDNNIDYGIKPDKNTLYLEKNGASKSVNIESYGDIDIDESLLDWFIYSGSDVIDITYSGSRCVIKSKKEGFARIRCTYPKLKLYCNIGVYVGQNVEFCFSDNNVIVEEEDCKFIELKLPDSFENPGEYITFESLDPNVCSVFGTGRVCCVEGIGKGSCIVRAVNSFDGSVCECGITVSEKELKKYKLSVSKTTYVLNPRSSDQRLKAFITGQGLNETENDDIEWEIVSDTSKSLSLYPNKGSEAFLKLNTITDPENPYFGRVGCGEALIKVRHPRLGDDYKTIYVVINELDNFFTLDKYSANVNVGSTVDFTCTVLNAKISDYDNVTWNVAGFNTDKYGNKVEVGRLLSKKGRTCTLYGLNDGICTVTAYYYGNVVQCEVNVNADRVFRINGATSVKMFPDARDDNYIDVSYILRPSQNVPIWSVQNLDKPSDVTVLSVEEVNGEQKIRIRPNGIEGRCSVSGFAVGIGQVSINVDVKFDPELRLNEEVNKVLIKMEDNGENDKEFTFYSYPAMYYVGVKKSGPYADYVSVYIDESELIGDYLQGKVHVKVNKEFPVNGCIVTLQQYTSSSLSDNSEVNSQNSKLSFSVSGYYEDSGFYLGYTKGRGNFINKNKSYNVNNNFVDDNYNTYFKFYDTNMKYSDIKPLELADCEKHYFVLKNRHANSFMEGLKINIISDEAQLDINDENLQKLVNQNVLYRENIETFSKQNFPKISKFESKSDGSFVFDIDTGDEGTDYGIDWNIMENKNVDVKKSHYFNSNKLKIKNLCFTSPYTNNKINLDDCIFKEKETDRYTIKYFYYPGENYAYVYSFEANDNYYRAYQKDQNINYYSWNDKMGHESSLSSGTGSFSTWKYVWNIYYNLLPKLSKEQLETIIEPIKDHSFVFVDSEYYSYEPILQRAPTHAIFSSYDYYTAIIGNDFYRTVTYSSTGTSCLAGNMNYSVLYDFDVGLYLFICKYDVRKTWDDDEGIFYRIFYCNDEGPGETYFSSYYYSDSIIQGGTLYLPAILCSTGFDQYIYIDPEDLHTLWGSSLYISMSHGGTDKCLDSTSISKSIRKFKFDENLKSENNYLKDKNFSFDIEELFNPGSHQLKRIDLNIIKNEYKNTSFDNLYFHNYNVGAFMYNCTLDTYYDDSRSDIVEYNSDLEFNSKVFYTYNNIFKIIGNNRTRKLNYLNYLNKDFMYKNMDYSDFIYKKIYLNVEWIELKNYDSNIKTNVIIPIYLNFYNNYYDYEERKKNRENKKISQIIDIFSND